MTKQQQTEAALEYFREEGYKCGIDGDGDVFVQFEGSRYCVIFSENDENFYRLCFFAGENRVDQRVRLRAMAKATEEIKVGKIFPVNETAACVAFEAYYGSVDEFLSHFRRALRVCDDTVRSYVKHLND